MANNWVCRHCGVTFFDKSSRRRRYCSQACLGLSRRLTRDQALLTAAARLDAKIARAGPDDCWIWQGSKVKGYGRICFNRRDMYAHRLAWEIANDDALGERLACHTCDTPLCCNPNHIYAGTPRSNVDDMISRGRQRGAIQKGTRNPRARLSEADVLAIKRAPKSVSAAKLAAQYAVKLNHIYKIRSGMAWSHLKEPKA